MLTYQEWRDQHYGKQDGHSIHYLYMFYCDLYRKLIGD